MTATLDKGKFQFAGDEKTETPKRAEKKREDRRWVRLVPMSDKNVPLGIEIPCGTQKIKVPCETQVPNGMIRQLIANARKSGYVLQWLPEGMSPEDIKRY